MQALNLRVLQVHNRQKLPGGVDVVIEREAEVLQAHGHSVSLFTVESNDIKKTPSWKVARNIVWNSDAAAALRDHISAFRPDIVHVHTVFPVLSPLAFRVTKKLGVPSVETMHNFRLVCPGGLLKRDGKICELCVGKKTPWPAVVHGCYRESRLHSLGMAATLSFHHHLGTFSGCVDRYLALTEFVRDKMIQGGYPAEKIVVKPNFVINNDRPGSGDGNYALFVGRFHPEKGVMTVVKAWKQLKSPLKLVLVGDGPQRDEVVAGCRDLNVEIHGWKASAEVFDLMRKASCVLFPSEWYEAGPLVPLESWSCGTPVIASDIGNFTSWIEPGKNGYLFQCGNPASLAEVVDTAVSSGQLAALRTQSYETYQTKFSPDANYKMLIEIYRSLLPATTRA